MNKCLLLTKILLKSGTESFSASGKPGKKRNIFSSQIFLYLLVTACCIPLMVLMFRFGKNMYETLSGMGLEHLLFTLICMALTLTTLLFSLPYVMSVMFFPKDLEYLLPLPLTSWQIAGAKFLTILVYEYYMTALIGIPILLGVGIASHAGIIFWIISLIILLFIPVLPIAYGSLLGLLFLKLTRNSKNREVLMTFFSVIIVVIACAFSAFSSYLGESLDMQILIDAMYNNENILTSLDYLFPTLPFARNAMMNSSLSDLFFYLAITLAVLMLYLALCSRFYLSNVSGMGESNEKRKILSRTETDKALKSRGIILSCASREWKLLLRTPVYFLNCVLMTYVLPLMILVPVVIGLAGQSNFGEFMEELHFFTSMINPEIITALLLLVSFGLSAVLTGINLTVSTCISREGQNFIFMKYIPVSYTVQLKGKVLCSVCISLSAVLPYETLLVLACVYLFNSSPVLLIPVWIISILTILLITYIQLLGDLWKPKLVWTSEQVPVKQNLIAMLFMLLCYLICALLGAGGVLLYNIKIPLLPVTIIFILVLGILTFGIRLLAYRYGEKAIAGLE